METDSMFMDWKTSTTKMSILPKAIYRSNTSLSKFQQCFFVEVERSMLKFI